MLGSPYPPEIRTVYVPVFESIDPRRGYEYQLTEAVQKEIQKRTHFRLAKPPVADTQLNCRIITIRKDVLGETAFDDPRILQHSIAIEATWINLRTHETIAQHRVPIGPAFTPVRAESDFAPELGHSLATVNQQTIDQLARQVVQIMENPW